MKRNGFALLELIVVLAIVTVLAGGGWYLQREQSGVNAGIGLERQGHQVARQINEQSKQEQGVLNQTETTSSAAFPIPIDTSNWQSYDMGSSGVTFKYPPNWVATRLSTSTVGLYNPSSAAAIRSGSVGILWLGSNSPDSPARPGPDN